MGFIDYKPNMVNKFQYTRRNFWSGVLFGIGMAAFLDEALFHLILGWHHFYDRSTTEIGLLSDGLFHAFGWFATVGSMFLVADLHRRHGFLLKRWFGAVQIGAGGFNLYDGTIQHKVFRIHQIRYDTDYLFIYDLVWNSVAAIIMITGLIIVYQTGQTMKSRSRP